MKTALRRKLSLLLCVVLYLCLIPAASAEEGTSAYQGFGSYFSSTGEAPFLYGGGAQEDASSFVPSAIDTANGETPSEPVPRTDVAGSLVLPQDTTRIEDEAFYGDTSITSVTIPAGVTHIGLFAFGGCENLREMHFDGTFSSFVNNVVPNIAPGNDALLTAAAWFSDGICFIPITDRYFPDDTFRGYVSDTFDTDGNGTLDNTEIQAATRIECYRMGISSLQGVEYFTELTYLDCGFNSLTELDVRSNTKLQTLGFAANSVSSIDLSQNTALKTLSCGVEIQEDDGWHTYGNNLTKLDVTRNTALEYLACGCNQLSALDVSKNTALTYLGCWLNNLSSLNLSKNKNLITLACGANPIPALNLSQNTKLQRLYCQNGALTSLDTSNLRELVLINCIYNSLTSLNVSGCTALKELYCAYNQLDSLSLSGCKALQILNCNKNNLRSLNVSGCTALKTLLCWSNDLTSMNLSKNTALVRVNLSANHDLSSVTIGSAENLEMLKVQNTNLSSINIQNLPVIRSAFLYGTMYDFGRYGLQVDAGDWVGYKYGDGINPGSTSELDHCQFCVDKVTNVIT